MLSKQRKIIRFALLSFVYAISTDELTIHNVTQKKLNSTNTAPVGVKVNRNNKVKRQIQQKNVQTEGKTKEYFKLTQKINDLQHDNKIETNILEYNTHVRMLYFLVVSRTF